MLATTRADAKSAPTTVRLFTAIELPDHVRAHLADAQDRLRRANPEKRATWSSPDKLHVTLKFLGEVDERKVRALCDALGRPPLRAPGDLRADHLECFPPRGAIRVIAAGLSGDLLSLRAIHAAVEDACDPLGFPREDRPFRPHVTLARAKPFGPRWDRETIGEGLAWPTPAFRPEAFQLMESHLSPEGARYVPVAHFPLNRATPST